MRSRPSRPRRRRLRRTRLGLNVSRVRRSTAGTIGVAVFAAAIAGLTTAQLLSSAASARDEWGDTVTVDVLTRDLAPGEVIEAAAVRAVAVPRRLIPAGAMRSAPVGRVATAPLAAGEPVVASRVASDLVPDGWRAIAIPAPGTGAHPDVEPGDAVDVLDVGTSDDVSTAEGVVVAVRDDDGMVTVAVPAEAAGRVAYAAMSGTAVLALTAAPRQR